MVKTKKMLKDIIFYFISGFIVFFLIIFCILMLFIGVSPNFIDYTIVCLLISFFNGVGWGLIGICLGLGEWYSNKNNL